MLALIRKFKREISLFLLFNFLSGIFYNDALALTSGPSQPETQQFVPAGLDNMVDPFTGDFSYNIPLMDVGGYPINLNYASGITPDAEASWVGLGWNLNVGAINRSVRGLPDDFSGDAISKDFNIKPNETFGVTGNISGIALEVYGAKIGQLGLSANYFYNTYNGFGTSMGVSPSLSAGLGSKNRFTASMGLSATLSSESGLGVTPTLGLNYQQNKGDESTTIGSSIGFPFNSREGLKGMTLTGSLDTKVNKTRNNDSEGKTKDNSFGDHRSVFQGFAGPTYTPTIEHNMYNINASLNLSFSSTDPATERPVAGIGGYYSGQFLKSNTRTSPAYGYMYSGMTTSSDKILDFNREKDGSFNKFTTNLAVTNFTYDVFHVSGHEVGGTYRMHRGDVGAVHDPATSEQGYSPGLGVELGFGPPPSTKVGVDVSFNYTESTSGPWSDNNSTIRRFSPENSTGLNDPGKEAVYFKKSGELAPEPDNHFLNDVQLAYAPFRNSITPGGGGSLNNNYDVPDDDHQTIISQDNQRTVRKPKETAFTTLTVKEAKASAIIPFIQNYSLNDFNWNNKNNTDVSLFMSDDSRGYSKVKIPRDTLFRKPHHISEIRVTNDAGKRYIYGIPSYNTLQEEVTFSKPGDGSNASTGLISYSAGADDSKDNNNPDALDNYFNKVSTPPYAYSYLLTEILSPDYTDRDGVFGPSDGDMGDYTKFNYSKAIDKFKWRTPYAPGNASFNEGMHGTDKDDKGNYVYGEKEIWYVHSIETRTHVAEFYLLDREDGLGVTGNDGSIDNGTRLKYLDKIVLYSKSDKWNSKPQPIKTVHFQYDYSLCPNVPNNTGNSVFINGGTVNINSSKGKLTLRKVWFTYANSQKGVLNPYVFNYADQDFDGQMDTDLNPGYDFKNYDRWGNYKKQNLNGLSNAEFPYSVQDTNSADRNSAVWALSSVKTPTGGALRVYYESDDYAYVQNKQAMRMFKVLGTADVNGAQIASHENGSNDLYASNYLVIDLDEGFKPVNDAQSNQEFRDKYLKNIDLMYYKMLLKVINSSGRNEYVPGYAAIDLANSQLISASKVGDTYKKAIIKLKAVDADDGTIEQGDQVNPISRNGWMFARIHLNRELLNSFDATNNSLEQILGSLLASVEAVAELVTGFSDFMKLKHNSQTFDDGHSFVRLNEPDKIKLGGGHRVKAIIMEDNWGTMKSEKESAQGLSDKETSFYGQSYNYTFQENGLTISSGVAAYEPIMGGEENPFRMPVFIKEKIPMAPSKEYYLEEPFGESFFPAPLVGYRKVAVTPLKITSSDLASGIFKGNATGRVEHEFYTAFDFPSITKRTSIRTERHQPNIIFKFMKFDTEDLVTCSQGYYVELNDMHGKTRAQRVYPEFSLDANGNKQLSVNKPISEIEYRYRINSNGTLNNKVPYINPDLSITDTSAAAPLGVDVDVVQDERHFETNTIGGGLELNFKMLLIGIFPIFVPTGYPDFNTEENKFRSVVTTKVVNKIGILESTTAKDNGISITTSNLAWDSKTGKVLLASVGNEFDDTVYTFTYPGHWAYLRMGLASLNEGMKFNSIANAGSFLKDGDEIFCNATISSFGKTITRDTTVYCNLDAFGNKILMDWSGNEIVSLNDIGKVIRSGSRNSATTTIGVISSLDNPMSLGNKLVFPRIIHSGVDEYKEEWKRFCACKNFAGEGVPFDEKGSDVGSTNDYILGLKGNIHPFRTWSYLTDRSQTVVNNNLNIRKDGYYTDFSEFWQYDASKGFVKPPLNSDATKWQFVNEIQNYNPQGQVIENKDALGRFSATTYGYGRRLPVAFSNNSMYRESGFASFEETTLFDCEDFHFDFSFVNTTNEEAHTGLMSAEVPKNSFVFTQIFDHTNCDVLPEAPPQVVKIRNIDQALANLDDIKFVGSTGFISDLGPLVNAVPISDPDGVSIFQEGQEACVECVPSFSLIQGKRYLISAWVKEKYTDRIPDMYSHSGIQIVFNSDFGGQGGDSIAAMRPKGPIVDGWQKIETVFEVPSVPSNNFADNNIRIYLFNEHTDAVFFDDIRIHPVNSNMKSFVYNPNTLKLTAELDENNYSTRYEYDDEGLLIRVKRETERGVLTVEEVRANQSKINK